MKTFTSLAWSLGIGTALAFVITNPYGKKIVRSTARNYIGNSKKRMPKIVNDEEQMYYI